MAHGTSANALELRIHNLLRPFRNKVHQTTSTNSNPNVHDLALQTERKLTVLCLNIAFLTRNHFQNVKRDISAEDVFVAMRGWTGDGVGASGGTFAILVRFQGMIVGVVKANLKVGANVMDSLCAKVDEMLLEAL
ncbi:hypothetical protein IAQ61_005556 [Plenodomus lingam]|uniref:Uncharacterized protein n=1 Tax=Leptosphaeria maculans (strain JN3 / isolate v23.1.3 / race Av1-4-5-6-7-8) TaxID=985895 RepID=E4ZYQ5_LEPMJ|nr:hypothetical protein LEMA_P108460.1 [Plenodomus lingam JN3]KAH9871377.1 hypothetical protein IAQ61_005556 [Plenodomus lingam]CBX96581.1 hypothetical protein LEMA_P108460.1 [Plenodomus lingam JN3]